MIYDDVLDLTQGVRDFDHPEIIADLKRWAELDEGDPIRWAKRRLPSRQYERVIESRRV